MSLQHTTIRWQKISKGVWINIGGGSVKPGIRLEVVLPISVTGRKMARPLSMSEHISREGFRIRMEQRHAINLAHRVSLFT